MVELTVSMIVKNEEKYLADCLESIHEFCDEIVIVDTGSTDNTIEIAKKYKTRIFQFPWTNDFSAARNHALQKSTGKWILYIDADERLSPSSVKELQKIVQGDRTEGVRCIVKSLDEVTGHHNSMKYIRLFRNNPGLKFTGKVHEQIEPSLRDLSYSFRDSQVEILHIGYNISAEAKKQKANRNLELLLEEYETGPNGYLAFQLGHTYMILGDKEKSVKYFKDALEDRTLNKQLKANVCISLAAEEMNNLNFKAAEEYAKEGLKWDDKQPMLNIIMSKVMHYYKRALDADQYCKKAYNTNRTLKEGKEIGAIDIILGELEIIYYGLTISVLNNVKSSINFFTDKLTTIHRVDEDESTHLLKRIIEEILNDVEITPREQSIYARFIDTPGMDAYMAILSRYKSPRIKLTILNAVKDKFMNNTKFLNQYALTLSENKMLPEAIKIMEKVIDNGDHEVSSVLYLVSFYLNTGDVPKVAPLIKYAEEKYKNNAEILSTIKILKQKIAPFLNTAKVAAN